jgi:hypothetical protein
MKTISSQSVKDEEIVSPQDDMFAKKEEEEKPNF